VRPLYSLFLTLTFIVVGQSLMSSCFVIQKSITCSTVLLRMVFADFQMFVLTYLCQLPWDAYDANFVVSQFIANDIIGRTMTDFGRILMMVC
jgi:hypothetical protein